MIDFSSERRMAENEVIFRSYNEKIQNGLDEVRKLGRKTSQEDLVPAEDHTLHFYCECSDENCQQRIPIKASLYNKIHANRRQFIVLHGHEVPQIEHVIRKKSSYSIVEKFRVPVRTDGVLNTTEVDNT